MSSDSMTVYRRQVREIVIRARQCDMVSARRADRGQSSAIADAERDAYIMSLATLVGYSSGARAAILVFLDKSIHADGYHIDTVTDHIMHLGATS